jgi:hypothetical protein
MASLPELEGEKGTNQMNVPFFMVSARTDEGCRVRQPNARAAVEPFENRKTRTSFMKTSDIGCPPKPTFWIDVSNLNSLAGL